MADTATALSIAWIPNRTHSSWPERHLLIGAAFLTARRAFGTWSFSAQTHATTITDDPTATLAWLAEALPEEPGRLLLWQAEANVVPALIATAETCRDQMIAARSLRRLQAALDPDRTEVIDVTSTYGGSAATSFDAIAHRMEVAFKAFGSEALHKAHRTGCYADIEEHVAARAAGTFALWLCEQRDPELAVALARWQLEPDDGNLPAV